MKGIFLEWLFPFTANEIISTPAQHTLPGWTPVFFSGQNWSPPTPRHVVSSSSLDRISKGWPGLATHGVPTMSETERVGEMSEAFGQEVKRRTRHTQESIRSKQRRR